MPNIKSYKRKKRIALIELVVFSIFFIGWLLYMVKDVVLTSCVSLMILWISIHSRYDKLCTKIELLGELQSKNNQNDDVSDS